MSTKVALPVFDTQILPILLYGYAILSLPDSHQNSFTW